MAWLPDGFAHPLRVDLPTGHHLRPIRADDVDLDLPAVMGSRERLWSIYGEAWGWPPVGMTAEADRADLGRVDRPARRVTRHEICTVGAFTARWTPSVQISRTGVRRGTPAWCAGRSPSGRW